MQSREGNESGARKCAPKINQKIDKKDKKIEKWQITRLKIKNGEKNEGRMLEGVDGGKISGSELFSSFVFF